MVGGEEGEEVGKQRKSPKLAHLFLRCGAIISMMPSPDAEHTLCHILGLQRCSNQESFVNYRLE